MSDIPDKPTTCVLDGDIIVYTAACWAERNGTWGLKDRLLADVDEWTPQGMTDRYVAISDSRDNNFRRDLWPLYKAQRKRENDPECLAKVRDMFLELHDDYLKLPRCEADDVMGIWASSGKAVAVTIDKDLRSVPGWHWNPVKQPQGPEYIDVSCADMTFAIQWITGDTTDNIPGIWKWGPAKALKWLQGITPDNLGLADRVIEAYAVALNKEKKPYTLNDALAQGNCVRILRETDWDTELQLPKPFTPIHREYLWASQ